MSFGGTEVRPTDFAITTVNVPDRLDQRDMDDRRQLEEDARRNSFDASVFRAMAPRLFLVGLLCILAFALFELFESWRADLSAAHLSQKFTADLGIPVTIAGSHINFSPSPRLLLDNVGIDGKLILKEVAINLSTRNMTQVFQGHGWNWGEASVAPGALTLDQCRSLVNLLPKLNGSLPRTVSAVRFEHLEISDLPWFTGPWDVVVTRTGAAGFAEAEATQHGGKGTIRFTVKPTTDPANVEFQMESRDYTLPFGAKFPVEEAIASGMASDARVDVSSFSLGGPFGAITGHLTATLDRNWALEGVALTEGVDVASLIRLVAPPPNAEEGSSSESSSMIHGTASFDGKIDGKGPTLADAANNAFFSAHVTVRSPVLIGINLGYAATHPGSISGNGNSSTRFSSLEAMVVGNSSNTAFRDIHAHAGALSAFGDVSLAANHDLSGHLHVDLGSTRVLAPIRVAVHGTILKPEFGR